MKLVQKCIMKIFLTQSLAHRYFKQYSKDKNLLLENILKYVNKQTYIPDPDFEVARHTLDFILSSGGDCDDRALFVHNFAQVFDIDCGVLIYKTYNDGLHAIAVCEYESSKPGFSISDTGVVRFSKSGKYKPMDYDKAGDLSIPFDSKNPLIVILKRQEGEIKVFSDFEK